MKNNKLPLLFLLILTISSFAQPKLKEKREKIKALKVAFITEELDLKPDEATRFWPIYNDYEDKQRKLKQEKMSSYRARFNGNEVDKMSDKEALNFLNQIESSEEELYLLRKKFNTNLKEILSPIKILKLKKAEEDFNRKLLQQYRNKKN